MTVLIAVIYMTDGQIIWYDFHIVMTLILTKSFLYITRLDYMYCTRTCQTHTSFTEINLCEKIIGKRRHVGHNVISLLPLCIHHSLW